MLKKQALAMAELRVSAGLHQIEWSGPTVLVVITVVAGRDLPSQSAITCVVVPVWMCLRVEDGLCERQPLPDVVFRRVWEPHLGGRHRTKSPEGLVVVS